jgi:hypothetical protein
LVIYDVLPTVCGVGIHDSINDISILAHYLDYSAMVGNFRYIPKEQKKLILTMSLYGMRMKEIENATGIKSRTIRRLTSLWK